MKEAFTKNSSIAINSYMFWFYRFRNRKPYKLRNFCFIIFLSILSIKGNCLPIENLITKGDYHLALQILESKKNLSSTALIENYLLRIECHKALEHWSQVYVYLKELDQFNISSKVQIIEKLIHYAHYYYSIRDFDKSLKEAKEALRLSKELRDPLLIAKSYTSVGYVFHLKRINETARIFFDSALVSINKNRISDEYILAWIYHCYGNSFNNTTDSLEHRNDFEKANNYYNRDLKIYQKLGNRTKIAQTLYTKGWLIYKIGKWELATGLFHNAIQVLMPDLISNSYKDVPKLYPCYNENLLFIIINQMADVTFSVATKQGLDEQLEICYKYHLLRIKLFLYLRDKNVTEYSDLPFYSSYDYFSTEQFADCAERI